MKRIYIAALAACVMCFVLTGCGGSKTEPITSENVAKQVANTYEKGITELGDFVPVESDGKTYHIAQMILTETGGEIGTFTLSDKEDGSGLAGALMHTKFSFPLDAYVEAILPAIGLSDKDCNKLRTEMLDKVSGLWGKTIVCDIAPYRIGYGVYLNEHTFVVQANVEDITDFVDGQVKTVEQ